MNKLAIQLQNIHKYYGKVHALRGLNLQVHKGEIFGFLGPNGAGKTTTIRCMLDLIRPNQGSIEIFGLNPRENPKAVKAKVGYLPGDLQLDGSFTPREIFNHIHKLRRDHHTTDDLTSFAERLKLPIDQRIKTLSQGNKQKVGLLLAFTSQAPLLMLDEPTLGLDPLMQQEVLNIVKEQAKTGATVFFSSHILSEVQKIADRVGIIRNGSLVEIASTQKLMTKAITRMSVQFNEKVLQSSFKNLHNVRVIWQNNDSKSYTLEVEGEMDALVKMLANHAVREISTQRPSLEEIFLKYYQDEKVEE